MVGRLISATDVAYSSQGTDIGKTWRLKNGGRSLYIIGDSTTDSLATGAAFFTQLARYTISGGSLEGVTVYDFGSNGLSLANWLAGNGRTGAKISDLPASLDGAVCRMGINDVRTGSTTQAQLRNLYVAWYDYMATKYPYATLALEVPNSLTTDDYNANGYVTATGVFVGLTIAQAAQQATNIMRDACYDAWKLRPALVILDAQTAIFGKTCRTRQTVPGNNPNLKPLMNDQLHPTDTANRLRGDWYAALWSVRLDAAKSVLDADFMRYTASQAAHTENFAYPYSLYPAACLDTRFWTVTDLGEVGATGVNYADVARSVPVPFSTGNQNGRFVTGDVTMFGDTNAYSGGISALNNAGTLRLIPSGANWTAVGVAQPIVGQRVYHCRPKFARASNCFSRAQDPSNNFQKFGYVTAVAGDGTYIDVAAYPYEGNSKDWGVLATDVLVGLGDQFNTAMSGFTIAANGNNVRLTRATGSFAGWGSFQVGIFGTR